MKETVNVNIGASLHARRRRLPRTEKLSRRYPQPPARIRHRNHGRHRGTHCRDIPRDRLLSDARHHPRHGAHGDASNGGTLGERRGNTARQEEEEAEPETRKLYRSRTDRSIAGICGGLADFFHVDATVMRLLMLFLIIFGGLSIWAYIILWIIIPEQPAPKFNINRKNR